MQIGNASTAPVQAQQLTLDNPNPTARLAWQSGQIIEARVLAADKERLLLQFIDQDKPQSISVRSPLSLLPGQQIRLQVEVEAHRIGLRLLDDPAEKTSLQNAWRNALPRQLPLAAALQHIARWTQTAFPAAEKPNSPSPIPTPHATAQTLATEQMLAATQPSTTARPSMTPIPVPGLPAAALNPSPPPGEQLKLLASELLNKLATPQQLGNADGLRQAVGQSGLFLEARLAQGDSSSLQLDFRASLLRLLAVVREQLATPPDPAAQRASPPPANLMQGALLELGQQLEGALSRIKVQQLQSLQTQSTSEPAWLLELPMRHGTEPETLRLRIQQHGGTGRGKGAPGWSVRLHFDNDIYGPVDGIVTLLGGKVGVSFWAERAATALRFQQHLESLRGQMQRAGLEIEHLRSVAGRAGLDDEAPPSGLLDLSV